MDKSDKRYINYVEILKEELIPAMGCTEPIALSYAASVARDYLGDIPDMVEVFSCGSIIKNVKSVIIPNTGHLKGIKAAISSGIIAGDSSKVLEVISEVTEEQKKKIKEFMENTEVTEKLLDEGYAFDLIVILHKGENSSKVRITNTHTNIVLIQKNDEVILKKEISECGKETKGDHTLMDIESIYDFIDTCDICDIKDTLERQIEYNAKVASEGINGNYGANIGKTLLKYHENNVQNRAKAYAAAASDARLDGCTLPVIINAGSGDQGLTCSIPVIEYAKEYKVSHEKLLRALALSNLVSIHEKTGLGTLSAFCGTVTAGAGAGTGIAYILGSNLDGVIHTIKNALAITSGMVCDGAKASCSAKIQASVDAGILGYQMYLNNQNFNGGDGILADDVDDTIKNIGRLGKIGMDSANKEILHIMIGD